MAPAKLNLFLHVTGQRSDGYHTLQTLFQLLDWGDTLTIERSTTPGIQLFDGGVGIPREENLIVRAAKQLLPQDQGVVIHCDKQIPMGGGLGGGSSDAAATLLGIDQLFALETPIDDLAAIGLQLGADVPVFVRGHSAWAEGIGEHLSPVDLPPRWYVVVHPGCHIATHEIFTDTELTRDTAAITMSAFFAGHSRNDLQTVVERRWPAVHDALVWLGQFAPALMTGSGACVFAAFDNESDAKQVAERVPAQWRGFTARGINRRPEPVMF
ncbi:MAG: 4-(cytidine 5'-diphospho)-2-C-methyl-D-erythritol kinase [Halieaceae bacterium]|jgi:4-diphosphocytidyl-2-C-methyl-D-erythritol kinase|nr:4-(cytidine 5'-diphospho)-2-C-methyl-D-erythritol kinase [Halieaceae bacterium]